MLLSKRRRLPLGWGLLCILVGGSELTATPINVSSFRAVSADDGSGEVFGASSPSTALGVFSDVISLEFANVPANFGTMLADQTSDIQPSTGLFNAGGAASARHILGSGPSLGAASTMGILFELTSPHNYRLVGALFNTGGPGGASFGLLGATSFTFSASDGHTSLDSNGVLDVGSYQLYAFATAAARAGEDNSGFSFTLQLEEAAVPEPATLWLLALGLGRLSFLRRR